MTSIATKTYLVGVIERAISYYEVDAENARTAAENWQEGEFQDRDDEALDAEGPCNVREKQPNGTFLKLPPSQWEAVPTAASDSARKPYSVLLLYPDCANDSGTETYYVFVDALDPLDAVLMAQRQAVAANDCVETEAEEFVPLLVTEGHQHSEPLFNK
jgi:hypothetical protein